MVIKAFPLPCTVTCPLLFNFKLHIAECSLGTVASPGGCLYSVYFAHTWHVNHLLW